MQEQGRNRVFQDYHLRGGQITRDTRIPAGHTLAEQRLDQTEVGEGTTVTLREAQRPPEWVDQTSAADIADWLGLDSNAPGLISWDVFDAVFSPGNVILLMTWRNHEAADAYADMASNAADTRLRQVRDYGMYDRRENPQYYPELEQP